MVRVIDRCVSHRHIHCHRPIDVSFFANVHGSRLWEMLLWAYRCMKLPCRQPMAFYALALVKSTLIVPPSEKGAFSDPHVYPFESWYIYFSGTGEYATESFQSHPALPRVTLLLHAWGTSALEWSYTLSRAVLQWIALYHRIMFGSSVFCCRRQLLTW